MTVPTITIADGVAMPQIALGLWENTKEAEVIQAVHAALAVGYRHFDTAQAYGNEEFLGAALAEADVQRQDTFITTKIWNQNQAADRLEDSFAESLDLLNTDYVDLLLLHFPVTETRRDAWPIMESIVRSGRAKAIGVSNYTVRHLEELLASCQIKPAVNQVELHVFLQQPDLLAYCKEQGIVVEAYSPLARGQAMDDPVLRTLADKYGKTPAQVMLRWCIEVGTVPLPKSIHAERIQENIDIFDFSLSSDDMVTLAALDRSWRLCWDPTNVE